MEIFFPWSPESINFKEGNSPKPRIFYNNPQNEVGWTRASLVF